MADWKDQTGFTRLQLIAGPELPAAPIQGFTQVEAPENNNYVPDTTNPKFAGKSFTLKSGSSGISIHATTVAENFYGDPSSLLSGSAPVNLFNANSFLTSEFLKTGTFSEPAVETHAVQNHSWVTNTSYPSAAEANQRLDHAINRDGFVCVVGENNGGTSPLPDLLGQGYHTISVGLTNGSHSAGFTTLDGSGRSKPDIVAPDGATSFATPMVSSAAGLLHSKLATLAPTLAPTDKPRVIKALLLASATRDTVASWSNSPARPLDARYGAGELNVHHAYQALRAGRATASNNTLLKSRGWAAESVGGNSTKTYHFTIPAGAAAPPFCAALTWHRVITDNRIGGFWGNLTTSMSDLNLRLYQSDGFVPGNLISQSQSTVDNVELVHLPALPPGNYALVVENSSAAATAFGLAWHSLPAVSIVATIPTARELDQQPGLITISRSGDTALPLFVPLSVSASLLGNDGFQPLPSSVMIVAGQSTVTLPVIPIADEMATGNRTLTVTIAADFALVRDPTQSAMVVIEDKPFDSWRFSKFTAAGLLDQETRGASADPDADQLVNLIEYALNLDPNLPDQPLITSSTDSGYLSITATKNIAATDIIWSAEVSGDLTAWGDGVILSNSATEFTARDFLLTTEAGNRQIRLKITRP